MYIYGYIDKNVINEDDAIDGIVNPYRRDVVAGTCTDFRSDSKAKMARGMLNFYENIPEGKAKAIRKAQIQHFSKTKYFKFRNGTTPSPWKTEPISLLSAVLIVGTSHPSSTITTRNTTSNSYD